jgi:anti-anti-sigma factor
MAVPQQGGAIQRNDMTCEVEKRDGRLHIRGDMTIYGAAALKDDLFAALEAELDACAIDLAGVSEFDTTGLQVLLMARKVCVSRGASLALTHLSDAVRETLELLRGHDLPIAEAA